MTVAGVHGCIFRLRRQADESAWLGSTEVRVSSSTHYQLGVRCTTEVRRVPAVDALRPYGVWHAGWNIIWTRTGAQYTYKWTQWPHIIFDVYRVLVLIFLGKRYFAILLECQEVFIWFISHPLGSLLGRSFHCLLNLLVVTRRILYLFFDVVTRFECLGLMFIGLFLFGLYHLKVVVAPGSHYPLFLSTYILTRCGLFRAEISSAAKQWPNC